MSKRSFVYTVPATQMDNLRAALAAKGVAITKDNFGSADAGHGYTVSWSYDAPNLVLTIDGGGLLMGIAERELRSFVEPFAVK